LTKIDDISAIYGKVPNFQESYPVS